MSAQGCRSGDGQLPGGLHICMTDSQHRRWAFPPSLHHRESECLRLPPREGDNCVVAPASSWTPTPLPIADFRLPPFMGMSHNYQSNSFIQLSVSRGWKLMVMLGTSRTVPCKREKTP